MKSYTPSPLVLLCFICSILIFTSCSKDSDLFNEYVLLEPETDPIESADSDGTEGSEEEASDEEEGNEPTDSSSKADGENLLLNGTFTNSDEWELLNGSTARDSILRIITSGRIQGSEANWAAAYYNISVQSFYQTRRYRLKFTARRVAGSDVFRAGQRYSAIFTDNLTNDFKEYIVEFNGEGKPGGNDLVFGGDGDGDIFELKNVVLEDLGPKSSEDGNSDLPTEITFHTDFETDQWGPNGGKEPAGNFWEVDNGLPRTTDHPDSPLKAGRNSGRAIWLGAYNNGVTRNELGKDFALSFKEHWVGVSVYIENELPPSRILIQNRLLANGTSNTVNAISLRQGQNDGQLYFSLPTNVDFVDQTRDALGGKWNGAGTNTEKVYFDYNKGEWLDIVIHYIGAFGANYTGPDTTEMSRRLGHEVRADGLIEIWVNGEKIVDHVGTTVYRYAKHGQEATGIITPKIGTYWSDAYAPQGDVYYDNYRIWTGPNGTYEDLDPSK
ncbi:hypothetical protein [uncultured Croceitalea sp.]|uniref:hypothetical protein n=1 Tax=uncultured Croceitalea sp. TaxID=1798908 RepID=UPI00330692B7